ncbi:MAG: VanZ family protein [Gemmatimonadetes bacterium]|nr:VanZ family protein [Gemmatimonadota bacterium]
MKRGLLAPPLLAIFVATLTSMGGGAPLPVWCVYCDSRASSDVLLNLILFLPLGVAIALNGWWGRAAFVAAGLLSAGIETAQFFIPGRDPSLGDVIFNTLGAAAGIAIVRTAPHWLNPPRRLRPALIVVAAALPPAMWAVAGFLGSPAFPRSTYYGQWTPNLANLEWYRARVDRVSLGPLELPTHRLERSEEVRARLLAGEPLTIRAVAGPRAPALGPLFSIADDSSREILLIGPDRDDLVFRFRMRARALRLDEPDFRLPGAMRGIAPGDTLHLLLWRESGGYCVTMNAARRCGLRFGAGGAWAFLMYPESLTPWMRRLLGDAWVAAMLVPLGLWARRRDALLGAAAAAFAATAVVPAAVGLAPFGVESWASATAGLALGALAQVLVSRRFPGGDFVARPPESC